MPQPEARPRTWAGFLGALIAALLIIAIWFPIRLIAELLKTIDFSEKPDHTRQARELFRRAYSLSRDLPSKNDFANSVLRHVQLPRSLHDAFFKSLRSLYAENMMLEVPPIPADLDNLDGIRWRDRMRREIGRMNEASLIAMRKGMPRGDRSRRRLPAQDRRRERNHFSARHARQSGKVRRRPRSTPRRQSLPRLRRSL